MLATQCSKPMATKAVTGNMQVTILSMTVRPAKPIHTARQTRKLHRMPRQKISSGPRASLPAATATIWLPMVLSPALMAATPQPTTTSTSSSEPTRLPM